VEGGRWRLFCLAMQSRRRRKKAGDDRCGKAIEAHAGFRSDPIPSRSPEGAVIGKDGNRMMPAGCRNTETSAHRRFSPVSDPKETLSDPPCYRRSLDTVSPVPPSSVTPAPTVQGPAHVRSLDDAALVPTRCLSRSDRDRGPHRALPVEALMKEPPMRFPLRGTFAGNEPSPPPIASAIEAGWRKPVADEVPAKPKARLARATPKLGRGEPLSVRPFSHVPFLYRTGGFRTEDQRCGRSNCDDS